MAQNGSVGRQSGRPLLGAKRTRGRQVGTSANDPQQTLDALIPMAAFRAGTDAGQGDRNVGYAPKRTPTSREHAREVQLQRAPGCSSNKCPVWRKGSQDQDPTNASVSVTTATFWRA